MKIEEAAEAIKNHVEGATKRLAAIFGAVNDDIERLDSKTDAAVEHLVKSKRTLGWILAIVLLDFAAGLWIGLKF